VGIALCVTGASGHAQTRDTVRIVSVAPADSMPRGVPVPYRFEIDVTLNSLDSGIVRIGFNSTDPYGWHLRNPKPVKRGRQRLVYLVTMAPIDWGQRGSFSVRADVGPSSPPNAPWRGIASDLRVLPVKR
jgi:hypothetical protein